MDCLPEVEMPIEENVIEEPEQNNIKAEISDVSDNEELIEELEKPKLSQEQIFQTPIIKKVNEKPPKKKRVLSEEHKAKLAIAREKALATRRANAAMKKETKELEKKVKVKKLNKLRDEVYHEVPTNKVADPTVSVSEPEIVKQQSQQPQISQSDLEAVALNAILGHEKIRKERKKKKKEEQAIQQQQNLLKQQLQSVVSNQPVNHYSKNGVWDDFF